MTNKNNMFEEYLKSRYQVQVSWYDHMANYNQKLHKLSNAILIVVATILPVGIAVIPHEYNIVNIFAAFIIAVIVAMSRVLRFEERWINYRSTAELLKREKYLFETNVGIYSERENAETLFVKRVESLISKENTLWLSSMSLRKDPR